MRKTLTTIVLATMLTVGVGYAFTLSPSGGSVTYNDTYVSTNNSTTTVNAGGPGVLGFVTLGTAATGSVITLFDSSGTATGIVIAKITVPNANITVPATGIFGVRYQNGLVVQQTGATSTFTISWQ